MDAFPALQYSIILVLAIDVAINIIPTIAVCVQASEF
jgi:hypothetical protein